jgi:hypothetical protein
MLAPRRKLWSTPDQIVDEVIAAFPLISSDKVVDIGCGDGRVILRWATHCSEALDDDVASPSFVGLDIDQDRIDQANITLTEYVDQGLIKPSINVTFTCANALEQQSLFADATVFFLYLIPRGLRIIQPMLRHPPNDKPPMEDNACTTQPIRVATYMSPLPGENPCQVIKVAVPHQPGAHWPVYLYRMEAQVCNDAETPTHCVNYTGTGNCRHTNVS